MEDDNAGQEFCEADIDHILRQRTQVIQLAGNAKGSTFAKASFNLSSNRSDINIDDPNFWQKWAKKADIDPDNSKKVCLYDYKKNIWFKKKFSRLFTVMEHQISMTDCIYFH